jgi:hypothetical protein
VPDGIPTKLTGHKTREVFDRYNIVNERDLSEGVAKLATLRSAQVQAAKKHGLPGAIRDSSGTIGGCERRSCAAVILQVGG